MGVWMIATYSQEVWDFINDPKNWEKIDAVVACRAKKSGAKGA